MPHILYGNEPSGLSGEQLREVHYEYDYAPFESLKPGISKLHKKFKEEVLKRARASYGVISNRFSSWNDIDKLLVTYVRPDEEDLEIKKLDPHKPIKIVFPYSYAVLETLLTHLSATFFNRPVFRYTGSSPEDTVGAILLEMVIQKHCERFKVPLALHTMFRDALAYGIGPVAPAWEVCFGNRQVMQSQGVFNDTLNRLLGRQPETTEERQVLFEGNVLHNIDPYCVLPDPGVSIHKLQSGEFFGWVEHTNLVSLLRREVTDEDYFNVQYLKHLGSMTGVLAGSDSSGRTSKHKISKNALNYDTKNVEVIHMYIDLIPSDWGVGESNYPEKWMFSLAGGEVIIRARPLELNHGMFPIAVAAPDYDGYSVAPISKLETQYGLQHTLNWLFNSHITNVRKALNDMFVVDPYMVNIRDLQTPGPGKLIRMRRPAWGRGVSDAVRQLQVTDVTQQHIGNASWIINWMNNIVGVDESLMGSMRSGGPERLTKAEFLGTHQSAMTRMGHMANVISMQAMQDIAYFFASHTQQLMSTDTYVNTVGEWQRRLEKEFGTQLQQNRMKVSPKQLRIEYDVDHFDGSTGAPNQSAVWMEMFTLIAEHPELNQKFDIQRIFEHIARSNGVKNVDEFYRIMPDEQVQQEVQAGNLIPNPASAGMVA